MVKLKRTYSLEAQTVETIERLAQSSRRDLSAIIELAVEDYARRFCDQCGSSTIPHPDPSMSGVQFCPRCQEAVSYAGNGKETAGSPAESLS